MFLQHKAATLSSTANISEEKADATILSSLRSNLLTPEVLAVLIRKGHNVHAEDEFVMRMLAATNNKSLFSYVATLPSVNIHATSEYALRVSSQNGSLEIVQQLVQLGADITIENYFPLRTATQYGHIETVKFLIGQGSNIHVDEEYCLRSAASEGNIELLHLFLENGADHTILENEALILACAGGHMKIVESLLVLEGTNASARNNMPLKAAIQGKHWQVCKALLKHGANPSQTNILEQLSELNEWDFILEILGYPGFDLNAEINVKVLSRAALAGDLILVQKLLRLGADPKQHPTLLIALAKQYKGLNQQVALDIFRQLVRNGATMETKDFLKLRSERHPFATIMGKLIYQGQLVSSTSKVVKRSVSMPTISASNNL